VLSPWKFPVTVYEFAADGVNDTWQDATPVVPVPAKLQLPEVPNDPVVGELPKLTDPVGVVAPLDAVSVTVAVHATTPATATSVGTHITPVDVSWIGTPAVTTVAVTPFAV
jgi:hypothetical protein